VAQILFSIIYKGPYKTQAAEKSCWRSRPRSKV